MTTNIEPVILWTAPGCGACIGARRMLESAGVRHIVLDAEKASAATRAYWRAAGLPMRAPIIQSGALVFQGADPERIAALA